jgi:hypothetical protein
MSTATPTLVKVEDHEGDGHCGHCAREGLRWICILSDGSAVGVECAKKVMGFKPAPKSYAWVSEFEAVAEHTECGQVFVLWQHKSSSQTRYTREGVLVSVGGARQEWEHRGWV